jgi:hypothetical protein
MRRHQLVQVFHMPRHGERLAAAATLQRFQDPE